MEILLIYDLLSLTVHKITNYFLKKSKQNQELFILYHSTNYIVVNKKHDLLINTNNENCKETVQTQLSSYFPNIENEKLKHKFHFVHRLDYVTSGVMCIALNRRAARFAGDTFTSRFAKKYYVALVRGWINGGVLSVNLAIGDDSTELQSSKRMCVETDPKCISPRGAHTQIIVLQLGYYNDYPATKVLIRTLTGRRHQIRVHLSHVGHTIIGDYTYSNRKDVSPPRTYLHCIRLVLPNSLEYLDVRTSDPFKNVSEWKTLEIINTVNYAYKLFENYEKENSQHLVSI